MKHLELFVAAYGADATKPKHHYAMHFAPLLRRFGKLQATFVGERRLKAYKEEARLVKVDAGFEKSVTNLLLASAVHATQDASRFATGVLPLRPTQIVPAIEKLLPLAVCGRRGRQCGMASRAMSPTSCS